MSNRESLGCLLWGTAFFSPFFLCGAAVLYLGFIGPYFGKRKSADWVETPCTIEASELARSESSSTNNRPGSSSSVFYSIEVTYAYEFDGQQYTSDRYDFTDVSDGTEEWKREVVERLKPGSQALCWVNPDAPEEAVLSRVASLSMWAAIPPTVFMLFGLFGLLFTFSTLFAGKETPEEADTSDTGAES